MTAPPFPDLRQAALRHLERFPCSEAGLLRVLRRKMARWRQKAAAEGLDEEACAARCREAAPMAEAVVADMARLGAVDDTGFAEARGRRLLRGGHSNRAILAHLARKEVPEAVARRVVPEDEETQLDAALLHARKRRIGPFRREGAEGDRLRERAAMARAGFPAHLAERALGMEAAEAEERVEVRRR